MRIEGIFKVKRCPFALEVFPPKRHSAVESVYGTLRKLGEIPADYVSVTYSAGGNGAREYTAQIAGYLKNELNIEPLAHITCFGASSSAVDDELAALKAQGVENVLALRGDMVPGVQARGDYEHASDLITYIKANSGYYIVAACYPEGHPEGGTLEADVRNLGHKLSAGAGHLVTQLFFDNDKFFRFLELSRGCGIFCPIEAGVMPIVREEQISRTISLSSSSMPSRFTRMVSRYSGNPDAFYAAGIDYAITQIRDLIEGGANGIHLYAMNNPDVARRVYDGIRDLL